MMDSIRMNTIAQIREEGRTYFPFKRSVWLDRLTSAVRMFLSVFFVVFLTTEPLVMAQFSKQYAGPYDFIVKEKKPCLDPGTDQMKFPNNKINSYNRTLKVYSSDVILPWGFTDDIILTFDVLDYSNGRYRKGVFTDKELGPLCSTLKKFTKSLATSLAKAMGFQTCPVPPGNYTIKDWPINIQPTLSVLPYHSVLYNFNFKHKNVKVGCISLKCDIVPKKKQG